MTNISFDKKVSKTYMIKKCGKNAINISCGEKRDQYTMWKKRDQYIMGGKRDISMDFLSIERIIIKSYQIQSYL